MARPQKAGLDYFEMDCHPDSSFKMIQAEFGLKGIAIVVLLLQRIYGERGYYCDWNEDFARMFALENGLAELKLIDMVVNACIRQGIFSREMLERHGILTSEQIQRNYFRATARRKDVRFEKEYLLAGVCPEIINVRNNCVNVCNNRVNVCNNPQSRVEKTIKEKKKSIEKKGAAGARPPVIPDKSIYHGSQIVEEAMRGMEEHRRKIRKPMTDRAALLMLQKLERAGCSAEEAAAQIDEAVERGWMSVFPEKDAEWRGGGKKRPGYGYSGGRKYGDAELADIEARARKKAMRRKGG